MSDDRVLLEILLIRDKLITVDKIATALPIGNERVRQILAELESQGYVEVERGATNFYVLTDAGFDALAAHLRAEID